MCLMLYIGTAEELPLSSSADLRIESVDPLDPERLFFNERFMHVIQRRQAPVQDS